MTPNSDRWRKRREKNEREREREARPNRPAPGHRSETSHATFYSLKQLLCFIIIF